MNAKVGLKSPHNTLKINKLLIFSMIYAPICAPNHFLLLFTLAI